MTREEAINTLHELWRETHDPWYEETYEMAIEALKVQTDGDLISRQAAIDAVIEWYGCEPRDMDDFKKILAKQPSAQPEPQWIPCSERLPEEYGLYLVTSREKATAEEFGFDLDDVEVKKMRFNEDGWRIPRHIPEWINGVVHTTVLAWMPLPEPYKDGR
jgi:hypothetical protein